MRLYARKSTLLLVFFAVSAVVFYAFLGRFILDGKIEFQFYADSLTYERLYNEIYFESISDMVAVDGNYLGPLLVLKALGGERLLVLFFNILILFVSLSLVRVEANYRWSLFVFLLFLSPLTFSSLISVNKEIISVLCFSFIVAWLFKRNFIYILAAFVFSFLVRWQLSVFVLMVFFSLSAIDPVRKRRLLYVLLLLLGISVAYSFVSVYFENVNAVAEQGALSNEGSGTYSIFNELQAKGLYFLIFIPKALQAMYGLIFKVGNVFAPVNIYNDIFVTLHCLVGFLVFCAVCLKRRLRLDDDLIFVAVIYCLVFVLTPIYSPRYFYPVFFLLCLVLSRRSHAIQVRNV